MLDRSRLPTHLGIIMDGNGRWAQQRGRPRVAGHRAGARAVRRVVRECRRLGISYLTLYAFSAQNWGRPRQEVEGLMNLLGEFIAREWQEIMRRDIRVIQLGEQRKVPAFVRQRLQALIKTSRHNRSMTLALALSYGAREEIVRAARRLARRVASGSLAPGAIDEASLSRLLYTTNLPDPDLIIRTGGEKRLSNFLLWQSAYSELIFSRKLWPDFDESDLQRALREFQRRRRRFGLTDEQRQEKP